VKSKKGLHRTQRAPRRLGDAWVHAKIAKTVYFAGDGKASEGSR
jgi:hypothetical protein